MEAAAVVRAAVRVVRRGVVLRDLLLDVARRVVARLAVRAGPRALVRLVLLRLGV